MIVTIKRLGAALSIIVAIVTLVVIIRAITFPSYQHDEGECTSNDNDFIHLSTTRLERFQQAIRLETIFNENESFNTTAFLGLHRLLIHHYPFVHNASFISREVINHYSLLYTIQGSDPSLKPYMLTGHMDVVPAQKDEWSIYPFSGSVVDGFLYGRGTLDNKNGVIGLMEALEFRLSRNIRPKRSFYLAFGHDEEVTGLHGAYHIGKVLADRGVQLDFLLDEGMLIIDGAGPGIDGPVAFIGVTEKGHLTLELTVANGTDNIIMPEATSNIGILAKAVARLENVGHLNLFGYGPEVQMLEHMATFMSVPYRLIMTNLWLFSYLVAYIFDLNRTTRAYIKTSTSVTMFHSNTISTNVGPSSVTAVVNHRVHPSQTVADVINYDKAIINDDRVKFKILDSCDPPAVSPWTSRGYKVIYKSIRQVFKDVPVVPAVMIGNTDTLHYQHLTKNIYRFSPSYLFSTKDLSRIHGIDERISLQNYQETINFYFHIYDNADKGISIHNREEDRALEL